MPDEPSDGLISPRTKSPLEESYGAEGKGEDNVAPEAAVDGEGPPPLENAAPTPGASANESGSSAAESPSPVAGGEGADAVPAPDTDEFLKSILDEKDSFGVSGETVSPAQEGVVSPIAQESPAELPVENPLAPPARDQDQSAVSDEPAEAAPEANFPPSESEPAAAEPATGVQIKDELGSLDAIYQKGASQQPAQTPPPPTQPPSPPEEGQKVSSELFSSGAKGGGGSKLMWVVILVVALVIGGYSIYSLSRPKPEIAPVSVPSFEPETPAVLPVDSPVAAVVDDQLRKDHLFYIQAALKLYADDHDGKYPVAEEGINLNTPDNILERDLAEYISAIPQDPDPSRYFRYRSDGATFELTGVLDNNFDPDAEVIGGLPIFKVGPKTQPKSVYDAVEPFGGVSSPSDSQTDPYTVDSHDPYAPGSWDF